MNHNGNEQYEEQQEAALRKHRKTKRIIIIVFCACLGLLLLSMLLPELFGGESGERQTAPPVDPEKLEETKEEGFNIFEYEEYLKYDRTVYYHDPSMGTTVGVTEETLKTQGEGFAVLYDLLHLVMEGDSEAYNMLVAEALQKESFTQQQVYGILVTKHSQKEMSDAKGPYTEYVYHVEYKIHENNGSYRNDIEPDASRPQYFVINNSSGEWLVMDVIPILTENK